MARGRLERRREQASEPKEEAIDTNLRGKVAVVTGGGGGIGEGIAQELAREGASVVVADVDEGAAEETTERLRGSGAEAHTVRCDVSDEQQVVGLMEEAVNRFGGLHVVVNNAGIGSYQSVTEATTEQFDRAIAVNLRGVFLCIKYAVPHMRGSGGSSIVNIASVHSVQNVGGTAPYAASKGGVAALTRAAAIDLAPDGIRVNAICPGWTDTPLVQGIFDMAEDPQAARREVEERQLLGRLGKPEDVGKAAVFLASDASSYMTGSLLFVDNGMTAILETFPE
jgi:NAD(P)-dependent dehydrogenase (short-subunit alcohol dehydrogenase family)